MHVFDLNGIWQLKNQKGEILCPVTVPGSVIAAMREADLIEDPYYRENEYLVRELFREDYEFARTFVVDETILKEKKVELICEGLDTLAEIFINGQLIAKTDNMHRTYRLDVKNYLTTGENEIHVIFRSVLEYIDQYESAENKQVHIIPSGGIWGNHLLRKGHSMLGWDWGPQLIDAGIWRNIYLETTSEPQVEDVRIRQHHENGQVRVQVEIKLTEETENEISVQLKEKDGEEIICVTAIHKEGLLYEAELQVENPKLWWPNGYGEHPLYDLTVTLEGAREVKKTIGLRTLTISQDKDQWGSEFAFMVNGMKIFTMGGNYIPEDAVYPWITTERIDYLLKSCVRANYNCVRVWGGGYYPSDIFYDLCDQYGLIVWQDLMYACNAYDVTKDFAKTARQEVIDNVRRLRHHASLGLWCGNNEIESAWDHWGEYQKESVYLRADYIRLFEEILPTALREEDDVTFYWPSSPSSGGCFDDPDDHNRGDNHYWDVWHGQKPFNDYQKYYFRFCSEFGFQSFPCLKTVESYTEESDRNIFSGVMESHQKNDAANGKILYYLSENFRYPKDFKHLLYISQILQGMAIKYGVDHWRRHRGRCMGTLYWQINDNWPVASWASVDYYGRWKALHYLAKKFYAPVALTIRREDALLETWIANETLQRQDAKVTLRIRDMHFAVLKEWTMDGCVASLSSGKMLAVQIPEELQERRDLFVESEAVLADGTILLDTDTLVPYKHMELETPHFEVETRELEDRFELTITSDVFAPFVELDFADADVIFSDNYMSISSEKPVTIQIDKTDIFRGGFADAQDLKERLEITSVRNTYA